MSPLGHKRTLRHVWVMSALPPKADINARYCRRYFLLTFALWRHHKRSAGERHLGQSERRLRLGRHFRRWRVQDGRPEPRIEGMTAAVPSRHRRLSLALAMVWTGEADVKMFGMSPPRSYLGEPAPVCSGLAAHLLLDRGVHENARDAWVLGGSFHNLRVGRRPHFVIDIEPIRRNDVHGRIHFALFAR